MKQGHSRFHESGWRESALQPPRNLGALPQGRQAAKSRATRSVASRRPGSIWVVGVLLALLGLLVVGSKLDQPESDWRDAEYCANVYAGKIPDYRSEYAAKCSNGAVKRANRQ